MMIGNPFGLGRIATGLSYPGVSGLGYTDAECSVHDVPGDVTFRSWNGQCVSSDNYARLANLAAAAAAAASPEGLRLAALTSGIQQGLYWSQKRIEFLNGLIAHGGWNAGQLATIQKELAAAKDHLAYQQSLAAREPADERAAGLQLVAADAPMIRDTIPLSAAIAQYENQFSSIIGSYSDPAWYAKAQSDAVAYDAQSAAAGAATRAAIADGSWYAANNVPSQFVPQQFGGTMPSGNVPSTNWPTAPNQSTPPRDTSVPLSLSMSKTPAPVVTVLPAPGGFLTDPIGSTGIPMWAGLAAGAAVLFMFARKK